MILVAVLCAVAGFLLIGYGFFATLQDQRIRKKIDEALDLATAAVAQQGAAPGGLGGVAPQAAIAGASEYVKALSELAASLAKLSPAIAAFVLSTVMFFFAATLAALHELK